MATINNRPASTTGTSRSSLHSYDFRVLVQICAEVFREQHGVPNAVQTARPTLRDHHHRQGRTVQYRQSLSRHRSDNLLFSSPPKLLVSRLGSGIGFMAIASLVSDIVLVYCHRSRRQYRDGKFSVCEMDSDDPISVSQLTHA